MRNEENNNYVLGVEVIVDNKVNHVVFRHNTWKTFRFKTKAEAIEHRDYYIKAGRKNYQLYKLVKVEDDNT